MKKFLIALVFAVLSLTLLTTLFVSATPLYAAVITADGENKEENQACSTILFKDYANDEQKAQLVVQKGAYVVLTAASDISRFVARWNKKAEANGVQPFPFSYPEDFDLVLVVVAGPDETSASITLFKDNCFKEQGRAPSADVPFLLSDGDPA